MKAALRWIAQSALPPVAVLLLVLLAWDWSVRKFEIPRYLVPSPAQVLSTARANAPQLAMATSLTAQAALCGLGLSIVVGTLVALIFSQSRIIQRCFYPYAIFLQTVPVVAIAPLVILWFGSSFSSVVIVAFILSLFPIITSTTAGLTSVSGTLLELFEMHNASRWQVLWKLRLPTAVPYLITGAQVSCGLSVIGAIVGEFFVGYGTDSFGLGYLINQTTHQFKTDYRFAAVICSTLLGVVIFAMVSLAGTVILARWHTDAPRREQLQHG